MRRATQQIASPRLMRSLPYIFNSFCTILIATTTYDAFNQPVETYIPHTLLRAIPCYYEPMTLTEARGAKQTIVTGVFDVCLQGYFPQITNMMQADVNGTIYNIQSVAHDDTRTLTMLVIEVINKPENA